MESLDDLNRDPILGIADDAEVMEVSKLMTKWLLAEETEAASASPKKSKPFAPKLNFNSLTLNTKSSDPLTLLKRRSQKKTSSQPLIGIHQQQKKQSDDILQFDDLLGLVNDIEKQHLLDLKHKVQKIKETDGCNDSNDKNKEKEQKARFEKLVYEHFQKSRGLVKKIKNIKNRKRRQRNKHTKQAKAKRYNARVAKQVMAKSRKKRLKRQSLHSW
mmetsp:Transcript_45803/g.73321  ORF Transcript_45803/g.73321 Transcript_45803/m.73321 type:complete len:216 (+) Transcript_45803:53-700(+)